MTDKLTDILPKTSGIIELGRQKGLHAGLQIYVSLRKDVLVDTGVGETDTAGRADSQPVTSETLLLWLSAGKPLTSAAILSLIEKDLTTLDATISSVVPEFGVSGKEKISIRHLLTHTGGFPLAETGWPHASWEESVARICAAPLETGWVIGQTAGYHPSSSWFILGEFIARLTGRAFSRFLREEICEPLGMLATWNGMPPEIRRQLEPRISVMTQRVRGEQEPLPWHDSVHCQAASPGVNTRGPIRELGRFYEALLSGLDGEENPVLSPDSITLLTGRQREGEFDRTLQHPVDFGLGVIVDSNRYGPETVPYGYGRFCSKDTFGHGGSQSSIGFADPRHGLVVAWAATSRAGEGQHQKRNREINSAIYEDLGLLP